MNELVACEEQERKPYVTSVERIASRRGMEQGLVQGRREMLVETLEARFGPLPQELALLLEGTGDPQLLKGLQRPAVTSESLEAFEQIVWARL